MGLLNSLFGAIGGGSSEEIPENCILIDVRSPGEFASGYIAGSVNLSLGGCSQSDVKYACSDLDANIVVYCASGMRSASFKGLLDGLGYKNVTNAGGISSVAMRTGKQIIR